MPTEENPQSEDGVYIHHKVRSVGEVHDRKTKTAAPKTVSRWIEEARRNRKGGCRSLHKDKR